MIDLRRLDAQAARQNHAALSEILADCVAGGASVGFMWPYSHDDAHRWWNGVIEAVGRDDTVLFGAFLDGRLRGTLQLGLNTPPNQPHRGEVKKLLVHRAARGRGLASRLMSLMEEEARSRGLSLLTLDTLTGSDAERLYMKLGWTKLGIIPDYAMFPDGRLCATSVFWKALQ